MARLGGKKVKFNAKAPDRVYVYKLDSMAAAIERYKAAFRLKQFAKRWADENYRSIPGAMLGGDSKFESVVAAADELIDAAIVEDPRLCKRAAWARSEDGVDACAALVAAGDDRPCFDRRKLRLADQATTEPVRIVVSTDSSGITPANAAAFVAAAKLAQQFRPLEIWWQGSWLMRDDCKVGTPGTGHVFLVPLVQGDMDFSRLEFVIGSQNRDCASFYIMASYAVPAGIGWQAATAKWSHLEDTFDFIDENGLTPHPWSVARVAARWAGMESMWRTEISGTEAVQSWEPAKAHEDKPITPEQRRYWEERDNQRKREELEKIKAREAAIV